MRVLVTGARGFIGSALIHYLEAQGLSVIRGVKKKRSAKDYELGDLASPRVELGMPEELKTVVHLAGVSEGNGGPGSDSFTKLYAANYKGTRNIARMAAEAGVTRFVYLSSIKACAESTELGAAVSSASQPQPLSHYGRSKLMGERALEEIAGASGMEWVIVRPPLVYGPGVGGNFHRLIQIVEKGWPLPFGALTENRRSYVFLANLISLLITCLDHPKAANRIFHVSDGEDVSTSGLIRRLAIAMGRPDRQVRVPVRLLNRAARLARKEEMMTRLTGSLQVDISHTREILDWDPPFSLDEGLALTLKGKSG